MIRRGGRGVGRGLAPRAVSASLLVAVLAACSPADSSSDARDPSEPGQGGSTLRYVAMGDSYTSAPGIAGEYSPDGCLRSPRNYPALVAADLGVDELVDVSCSGAQTLQMEREHVTESEVKPPQLDALTKDTDLVTLSIGANDYGLFSTLTRRCAALAERDPEGAPCRRAQSAWGWDRASMHISRIRDRVAAAVHGIAKRAPAAHIIVVGYPQLVPEDQRCLGRIPLARGDYPYVRQHLRGLSKSIRAGAQFAGADFVNLLDVSRGHDACAKRPWMNGAVDKPDRAMPYHPYPAEQRAVADLIVDRLDSASAR